MAKEVVPVMVGFTGTRKGMSNNQLERITGMLKAAKDRFLKVEFHHGDCLGADAEAHAIALKAKCKVVVHPPINQHSRAFCKGGKVLDPQPYLDRNRAIIDSCDVLLACPSTAEEQLRSGTWATIRYTRKAKVKVFIIKP